MRLRLHIRVYECESLCLKCKCDCNCSQTWIHPLLWAPVSWPFYSLFIYTATSLFGPQWTPAMTMRAPWAVACPSLRTLPSIALWLHQMCAVPHLRTTACRPAQRARATTVMRQTRSWATMPASWQTSTGMRSPRGGRASPCTMVSSTPVLSTSPSTWVRTQQHIFSSLRPPEFFSLTFLNLQSREEVGDLGQVCVCSGSNYGLRCCV